MYITPDDEKNANVKLDSKGNLVVGLEFLYESLSEEDKQVFVKHLAWSPDVFADIENATLYTYATDSYNSNIYQLRKRLLEQTGVMERSFIRDLLSQLSRLRKEASMVHHNKQRLEKFAREINARLPEENKMKEPFLYHIEETYTVNEMIDLMLSKQDKNQTQEASSIC